MSALYPFPRQSTTKNVEEEQVGCRFYIFAVFLAQGFLWPSTPVDEDDDDERERDPT